MADPAQRAETAHSMRRRARRTRCPEREHERRHHPDMTLRSRLHVCNVFACIAVLQWHIAIAAPRGQPQISVKRSAPAAAAPAAAADPSLQLQTVCGDPASYRSLDVVGSQHARFTLAADGDLAVDKSSPEATSFMFNVSGGAIARIELVSSKRPRVWCSEVKAQMVYTLPNEPPVKGGRPPIKGGEAAVKEGDMLRVQLYTASPEEPDGTPHHDPPELVTKRAAVLKAAQLAERNAVRQELPLRDFLQALAAERYRREISQASIAPGDAVIARLQGLSATWQCPDGGQNGPMAPAICDEIGKLTTTMLEVMAILREVQGARGMEPGSQRYKDYYHELPALLALLHQDTARIDDDARRQQCITLGKLRSLDAKGMFRLAAQAQLPVVPASRLAVVRYDGTNTASGADVERPWAMIVTRVPRGTKLTFGSHLGKSLSIDPASTLPILIKAGVGAVPLTSKSLRARNEIKEQLAHMTPSLLCATTDEKTTPPSDPQEPRIDGDPPPPTAAVHDVTAKSTPKRNLQVRDPRVHEPKKTPHAWLVDPELPAAGRFETVSGFFDPFDGKKLVDLLACTGDRCAGPDADKNVVGRVSLTPDRTGSWTLLADVSVGFGLWGSSGTIFDYGPFALQSAPGFEPVGRGDGPDQLFEMDLRANPRNAISTGLILGRYVSDHWLLGVGPALTIGGASGVFSQWNARLARRLGTRGVYLTFGPSVRFLPQPDDFRLHDRVSIARPPGGVATAPEFRTSTGAELQFDIGLSIDIGTLGAAASDTIKSFGGGK